MTLDALLRAYESDELGPDGYPLAWHSPRDNQPAIKHHVREQAGHRCVRCGHPYAKGAGEWSPCDEHCTHQAPIRDAQDYIEVVLPEGTGWVAGSCPANGQPVEARWRILTVHHLDGDKANCRWWNLAALCQRCHLTIQGRVVLARVYPFEHSDWFKPYAAGWYAWSYLGVDLTREQTLERLEHLLALERQEGATA